MSLLNKNNILKEYRRQHREELAAAASTAATPAPPSEDATVNDTGNDADEFPDVDAFQVIGNHAAASPPAERPSLTSSSTMSLMGRGAGVSSSGSANGNGNSDAGKFGFRGGAAPAHPKLVIRSPPPDSSMGNADSGGGAASSQERVAAAVSAGRSKSASHDQADGPDEDEFPDLDRYSSPLPLPTTNTTSATRSPHLSSASPTANGPPGAVPHSRSDLTGEEDRVVGVTQTQSPATDPSVSPTSATAGGMDTFLSAAEVTEGLITGVPGGGAAVGPSLHPLSASGHVLNGGSSLPISGASESVSRPLSSIMSAQPPSLSPSKPHSPTSQAAPPQLPQVVQLTAEPAANVSLRSTGAGAAGAAGPANLEVSSSSSDSDGDEAPTAKGDNAVEDDQPSQLSEEAVGQLGPLNNTFNSAEGETLNTGGSPTRQRLDVSDTQLQPPTSILSDPSTLDMTTATLASLRQRSHALRAMEKQQSASGKRGSGLPTAPTNNSTSAHSQLQSRAGTFVASSVIATGPAAATTTGANGEDEEDDVFSRVSATECVDGGSPLQLGPSLVDTRVAVAPTHSSSSQHMLSFSGTARTLPRIGEDEDVDVDPSSTFTDPASRGSPLSVKPITFYEAYVELTKDMQTNKSNTASASGARGQPKSGLTVPGSGLSQPNPPPWQAATAQPKKKSALKAIFYCCNYHESEIEAPPAYVREASEAEVDLERRSAMSGTAAVAAAASAEEALHVVQALKSRPLSLQQSAHRRMLFTVFNILTGKVPWPHTGKRPPPGSRSPSATTPPSSSRHGVNWEAIGFQGTNPATDVRATGVLGVLQLLYVIDYYPTFAQRLWTLCQHPSGTPRSREDSAVFSPASPKDGDGAAGLANELPFVLVCFNFTAVLLDVAEHHLLDGDIRKATHGILAAVIPSSGSRKPEAHLASAPGMFICCEYFVGALELFAEAWYDTHPACRRGSKLSDEASPSSQRPQQSASSRPSIADFGELKAKLRTQLLKKGSARLLEDAVHKVRAEELLSHPH